MDPKVGFVNNVMNFWDPTEQELCNQMQEISYTSGW
jgi:hypothetical protein